MKIADRNDDGEMPFSKLDSGSAFLYGSSYCIKFMHPKGEWTAVDVGDGATMSIEDTERVTPLPNATFDPGE